MIHNIYKMSRSSAGSGWMIVLLAGSSMILFGTLIILVPEILVALVASVFFLSGIGLVTLAVSIRNRSKWLRQNVIHYYW